ncbi:MAG: hypothetical protein AAGG01_01760 [Planctomycetota bacterium]
MQTSKRAGLLAGLVFSSFLAGSCLATRGADGADGRDGASAQGRATGSWRIDTQAEWVKASAGSEGLVIEEGMASSASSSAIFRSRVYGFGGLRTPSSITLKQSDDWLSWEPVENLGPINLQDAPVFLAIGEGDYWAFGRYGGQGRGKSFKRPDDFVGVPAALAGFEGLELLTTPYANQFDAPGGLVPGSGGYHAWQSRDMVNWVHHGPVTERFSRWVTSAEHVDGKTYIFYDFPNDQDPHVYEDQNLFDGEPGKNLGLAFADPSHGSDAGFIRDLKGRFHVIFEDWSPISANKRSWDSPLAGHAVSDTPAGGYRILAPAVDQRTNPTGEFGTYKHPHWVKEDPERFQTNVAEYEIHEPEQEAFGDWAIISIGGQYYLFGDHDPAAEEPMAVGWFTAPSLDGPFEWCGRVGKGHPDPDIGFAEGRFYLFTQQSTDYVSDGPWVDGVDVRVGVDIDGDGGVDVWSPWETVKETYDHTPGFSKQIARTPAALDLSALPRSHGAAFELRLESPPERGVRPVIDAVELSFR